MSKYLGGHFRNVVSNFLNPNPKDVNGTENESYFFYQRELFLMIQSIFDIENLPPNWNKEYILDKLFRIGYMAIVSTDLGVLCLDGGYYGINVYKMPTHVNVANPVIGNLERTIGIDGELLYFNYSMDGYPNLYPLVKRYAVLLSQCDGSLNTNLINSRLAHVFMTNNKANMETAKKVYDDISNGKPAVFINKNNIDGQVFDDVLFGNVKNVFIGKELLDTKRTIRNEFLTEIGINNVNTDKKERLITQEAEANEGERLSLVSLWLRTLNSCLDNAKETFKGELGDVKFVFNKDVIKSYQTEMKGADDNEPNQRD